MQLRDAFKTETFDQDKVISPKETIQRFKSALKKVDLDIFERTERIDSGRLGIPVFFSVCGKDAKHISGTKKQMGKGADPEQAEASAMMELAERFSFFSFRNDPKRFFTGSFHDAAGQGGDEPLSLDMIARSVNDDSPSSTAAQKILADIPMKWAKGHNLTLGRDVMIPFDWFFAINEFNGTSAGNVREEALTQGLCEVVERHVSFLASEKIVEPPGIHLDSATDPAVKGLIEKYRKAGIEIYASDMSCGVGIPTVGVLGHDPSTFPQNSELVWTAGTAPNAQKALARALTETAQLAGDFNSGSNYVASGLPKFSTLAEADFLIHPKGMVDISSLPDVSNVNMKHEVERLVDAITKIGMEALVIDTTHPLLQIPAFYTMLPGAHFRERANGASVAMFSAKIISETISPDRAAYELGRLDEAVPNAYFVKFYLGLTAIASGKLPAALKYLAQALEMDPLPQDTPAIYSYMGLCLKDMGEYKKALAVLERGAEIDSQRTDIHNLTGFCYFMLKEHEKAIAAFEKVIAIDPSSAIDYANIASNYRDMGETQTAIHYYELALGIDPSIDFARTNLAKLRG